MATISVMALTWHRAEADCNSPQIHNFFICVFFLMRGWRRSQQLQVLMLTVYHILGRAAAANSYFHHLVIFVLIVWSNANQKKKNEIGSFVKMTVQKPKTYCRDCERTGTDKEKNLTLRGANDWLKWWTSGGSWIKMSKREEAAEASANTEILYLLCGRKTNGLIV